MPTLDIHADWVNRHTGLAAILRDLRHRRSLEDRIFAVMDLGDLHRGGRIGRLLGPGYADSLVTAARLLFLRRIGEDIETFPIDQDCFAFWLKDDGADGWAGDIQGILATLREPLDCDGLPGALVPSAGLARWPRGTALSEDIVLAALVAAQDARASDESWLLRDREAAHVHKRINLLLAGLRPALTAKDQLRLVYQPRIDLRTGECLGAEALIRWEHPVIGGVPPIEFIPLAEETGLIRLVTSWVIDQALTDLARWTGNGYRHGVSVNVSALNLAEDDFVRVFDQAIRRHGADPALVEVELTEGALIHDSAKIRQTVTGIASLGVGISIDDFGTGYSNLFYLRQFPATALKIDQSFVRTLTDNARDKTIVRSMIELAHELGYRVVAEGIETKEACDLLTEWGCDEGQGYHLSRPIPSDALLAWISGRRDKLQAAS